MPEGNAGHWFIVTPVQHLQLVAQPSLLLRWQALPRPLALLQPRAGLSSSVAEGPKLDNKSSCPVVCISLAFCWQEQQCGGESSTFAVAVEGPPGLGGVGKGMFTLNIFLAMATGFPWPSLLPISCFPSAQKCASEMGEGDYCVI